MTRDPWATNDGLVLVLLVAYGGVGYVIARTQPRNPIGWIFIALGIAALVDYVARLYLVLDYREHGGRLPLGTAVLFWRGSSTIFPFLLAFPAILLFPDGRLSPRWRKFLWAYVVAAIAFVAMQGAGQAIDPTSGLGNVDLRGNLPNSSGGSVASWSWPLAVFFLVAWVAFVWRQVSAWRSASGVQRAQLKWLAAGSAICVLSALVILLFGDGFSTGARIAGDLATIGIGVLPVALGVAILRYRLYEIDRLISRTLSYAVLTGCSWGLRRGRAADDAGAAVLVACRRGGVDARGRRALQPAATRVQRLVDHRFNRARYDREALVAASARGSGTRSTRTRSSRELAGAAASSVEPAHISVWVAS